MAGEARLGGKELKVRERVNTGARRRSEAGPQMQTRREEYPGAALHLFLATPLVHEAQAHAAHQSLVHTSITLDEHITSGRTC